MRAVVVGLAILEKQLNAGLPTGKPNDQNTIVRATLPREPC